MSLPPSVPVLHEAGPPPVMDGEGEWVTPAEQRCLRCGAVLWSFDPTHAYYPGVPNPWPAGPVTSDGIVTMDGDYDGAEECRQQAQRRDR